MSHCRSGVVRKIVKTIVETVSHRSVFLRHTTSFLRMLGFFSHDFACFFVFTQTHENGMAQTTVHRPFSEAHLCDKLRFHPGTTFHLAGCNSLPPSARTFLRQIGKRTLWLF